VKDGIKKQPLSHGEDDFESSGIPGLDDAVKSLDNIPKILGRRREMTRKTEGHLRKEMAETGETEENPLQPALVRAMITAGKLARHLESQREKPGYYGVVFSRLAAMTDPEKFDYGKIQPGTKVKILTNENQPELMGQVGYTANEPDSDGLVMVLFDEGEFGHFLAVPPDEKQPREIEIVPGQDRVIVLFEGRFIELASPEGMTLSSGQVVKLDLKTNQILDIVSLELPGEIATVKCILGGRVQIDFHGTDKIVAAGDLTKTLEPGNQVILDSTNQLITGNLGDMDVSYRYNRPPAITWDDIGGQTAAKAILQEMIEARFDHPAAFERFHKKPPKGLLLLGPTGCGKTMLAEAMAYSLSKRFGETAMRSGFFLVKGPEILRSLVGEQEAIMRHIFVLADKHFAKFGFPAIIFIDECEGILKKRGTGTSGDYFETLVQTFLALMNDTKAIVVLATNRPDMLDPAVVRHKRIDRKIPVRRPDRPASEEIFRIYLKDLPLSEGLTGETLAKLVTTELFSDCYGMYKLIVQTENGTEEKIFGLAQVINGAMIAGIVDEATSAAVNRQIKDGKETSLTADDLKEALSRVYQGELLTDHTEDQKEFGENLTGKVLEAHKLFVGRK